MGYPTFLRYLGFGVDDTPKVPGLGGVISRFKAGGTLYCGEAVILSAAQTVNKSTANLQRVVGVVVGGAQTNDDCIVASSSDVGIGAGSSEMLSV